MNKIEYKKFLEAVDTVCINCLKLNEENCNHCAVRFTCDELNKKIAKSMNIEIKIGCEYIFETIDLELEKYNGTKVKIIKPLNDNMYEAVFEDGNEYDVFEDELGL